MLKFRFTTKSMKSKQASRMFAAAVLLTMAPHANAATLARYDMEALTISGTQSTSPDVAATAGIAAGAFTENLVGGTSQAEFGIAASNLIPAGVNGASARSMNGTPPAPSNPWWEFTITPDTGSDVALTTLTLDAGAAQTLSTTPFNWNYDVFWSVDSFASLLGTFVGPSATNASPGAATALVVDLSALPSQTSAFTIRIAPNRVSGTNGATTQRAGWIDNVQLNGNLTTVPEPSSTLLGGLALLALLRRHR